MLKRIMIVLLCVALLAPCAGNAAQLIGAGLLTPNALTNSLPLDSVYAGAAGYAPVQVYELTDNNAATVWNAAQWGVDKANTACLTMTLTNPADVDSIWVRNGSAQDTLSYANNGYAARLDVYLWTQAADGSLQQAAAYAYQLDGAYNPYERSEMWTDGYQCLKLPYTAQDISAVMIYVTDFVLPAGGNTVCISDIGVCGTSLYAPLTTPVYSQATPVPYPQATSTPYVDYDGPFYANLLKKIATRTGPGTEYTEPGTYLTAGDTVEVISLVYDENDIAWVQLDFYVGTKRRRAYTGLNRVDAEAWRIPLESPLGNKCYLDREVTPRMGPGTDYVRALANKATLPYGTNCTLICYEGEWAMIELQLADQPISRMWVPRTSLYVW